MSDGGFVGDLVGDVVDFGTDLFDAGFDAVSSFTDSFGTEFLSGDTFGSLAESFTSSIGDVAGSLYETVGSFAGNATWFDTFNPGSIINSAVTTVSDFAGNFTSGITLPSFSSVINVPGIVNSTVANLAGPFAQPVTSILSGSVPGISTGYGSLATPGFGGALTSGPGFVNSTISNLTSLPGQIVGGVTNTGARAVNATLSNLVGPAVASTSIPRSLTTGTTAGYNTRTLTVFPQSAINQSTVVTNLTGFVQPSTLTQQINAVAQATGVDVNAPLTAQQQEIFDIGQRINNPSPVDTPSQTLTEQINAVAQATGVDVNAPLTAQEQEIFDIGQRINRGTAEEVPAEQRGDELVLLNTGEVVGIDEDGFTEAQGGLRVLPEEIEVEREGNELINLNTGEVLDIDDDGFVVTDGGLRVLPEEVDGDPNAPTPEEGGLVEFTDQGPVVRSAADVQALRDQARAQQTVREQRQNRAQSGDWRVRLRLAPTSTYLYNAADCGPVLQPLRVTDGVIFPYTPSIDMAYKANYSQYDLTHSNYRGYFYQNSAIDAINLKATFTAQDTVEANYLLAVIHFFRSATKMFYGQDAERGSPPPLTYLSGLGDYQFNEHPCLISQFNYSLPADVDYIRAQTASVNGQNLLQQRDRQTIAGNPLSYAINRLASVGLTKGALDNRFAAPTLGINNPTYVPTKMEIQLTLLPTQSRQQVSKQFSVKNFANGNLLKGGFW
jgi:hypothetical protein